MYPSGAVGLKVLQIENCLLSCQVPFAINCTIVLKVPQNKAGFVVKLFIG